MENNTATIAATVNTVTRSRAELPNANPHERLGKPLPREGENGLFSQAWFPICLSEQVQAGALRADPFLDGRVLYRTVYENKDILNTIHYLPGALTKGDTTLSRYLSFLRSYPRAHPSAAFIR